MREQVKRIVVTLLVVGLYRLGAAVPLPGVRSESLEFIKSTRYSSVWQYLQGNPASSVGFFALGIAPYITSGLVLFLLGNLLPALKRMRESGQGRERMRRITRLTALIIALFQAIALTGGLQKPKPMLGQIVESGKWPMLVTAGAMVLGFLVVSLLAEVITRYGVGSGVSVFLLVTLLSGVGARFQHFLPVMRGAQLLWAGGAILFGLLLVTVGLRSYLRLAAYSTSLPATGVPVPEAEFRPTMLQGGVTTLMFASTMLGTISGVAHQFDAELAQRLVGHGMEGAVLFVLLLAGFARLQMRLNLDPVTTANDLVSGGYILVGSEPGWQTAQRISHVGNVIAGGIVLLLVPLSVLMTLVEGPSGGLVALMPLSSLLFVTTISLELLYSLRDLRPRKATLVAPVRVDVHANPWQGVGALSSAG